MKSLLRNLLIVFLIFNYSCVSVVTITTNKKLSQNLEATKYFPSNKLPITYKIEGNYLVGNVNLNSIIEERKYDIEYLTVTRLERNSDNKLVSNFEAPCIQSSNIGPNDTNVSPSDAKEVYSNAIVQWLIVTLGVASSVILIDWISVPFRTGKNSSTYKVKIDNVIHKISSVNSPDFFIKDKTKYNITNGVFKIPLDYFVSKKIDVFEYSLTYKEKDIFKDSYKIKQVMTNEEEKRKEKDEFQRKIANGKRAILKRNAIYCSSDGAVMGLYYDPSVLSGLLLAKICKQSSSNKKVKYLGNSELDSSIAEIYLDDEIYYVLSKYIRR